MKVYLLTGGNLGNRYKNLMFALESIALRVGKITRKSNIYETSAWGVTQQPAFLNQVIEVDTKLEPLEILMQSQIIELEAGRVRHQKWYARTLDIDLLFVGNQIINSRQLIVPHPHLHKRNFTLIPLAELIPDFQHPILKKSVSDLLHYSDDMLEVTKYENIVEEYQG